MTFSSNFLASSWLLTFSCQVIFVIVRCDHISRSTPRPVVELSCISNADCPYANTYCEIGSPTCGGGICKCIPGYAYDHKAKTCKRAISGVGTNCDPGADVCTGRNVTCSRANRTCSCPDLYQPGHEGDCVPQIMTKSGGHECEDTAECYYSLVCLDNRCGCFTGYKIESKTRCIKKAVGDLCTNDRDCVYAPNSYCKSGTCQCLPGNKKVTFVIGFEEKQSVNERNVAYTYRHSQTVTQCIAQGKELQPEGAECSPYVNEYNEDADASAAASAGRQLYCKSPFICSPCGRRDSNSKQRYVCARQSLQLMSSAPKSSNLVLYTILAAAFSGAIF